MGCDRIVRHAEALPRRRDGRNDAPTAAITLETVYCLGNCALSPAVMLDGDLYGCVDEAKLTR